MTSPQVFKAEWEEAAQDLKAALEGVEEAQKALRVANAALEIARTNLASLAERAGLRDIDSGSTQALAEVILEMVDPWPRDAQGNPLARPG